MKSVVSCSFIKISTFYKMSLNNSLTKNSVLRAKWSENLHDSTDFQFDKNTPHFEEKTMLCMLIIGLFYDSYVLSH